MVKHQRRSHQRGIHSAEIDDGDTSDSDSGDSPSTPSHSSVHWPQAIHSVQHGIQRAQSYSDFGHPAEYSPAPYAHRHSLSGSTHDYHGLGSVQDQYHSPSLIQHAGVVSSNTYYIAEQSNPGVATMNTSSITSVPRYHIPIHASERQAPYPVQALPGSVQTSPGGYSAKSRSPTSNDIYYTHHQAQSIQPYPLPSTPMDPNQHLMQYQQQSVHHPHEEPMVLSVPPSNQAQAHYHAPPEQHWYANQYQEPVEVISSAHSYTSAGFYDPWGTKIEAFDDPSMQLPSARIATL